jgi:hypothetical protein
MDVVCWVCGAAIVKPRQLMVGCARIYCRHATAARARARTHARTHAHTHTRARACTHARARASLLTLTLTLTQVFISYGSLSNGELLRQYGFVLDGENPNDVVNVPFEWPAVALDDPLGQLKTDLLAHCAPAPPGGGFLVRKVAGAGAAAGAVAGGAGGAAAAAAAAAGGGGGAGPGPQLSSCIPAGLVQRLRALLLTPADVESAGRQFGAEHTGASVVSAENERAVAGVVRRACDQELQRQRAAHDAGADLERLREHREHHAAAAQLRHVKVEWDGDFGEWERCCMVVRSGEQALLSEGLAEMQAVEKAGAA